MVLPNRLLPLLILPLALVLMTAVLPDKVEGVKCYSCTGGKDCKNPTISNDCSLLGVNNSYCMTAFREDAGYIRGCAHNAAQAGCVLGNTGDPSPTSGSGPASSNLVCDFDKSCGGPAEHFATCYCTGNNCNKGTIPFPVPPVPPAVGKCYSCKEHERGCQTLDPPPATQNCPTEYCRISKSFYFPKGRESVSRGCAPWSEALNGYDSGMNNNETMTFILNCYTRRALSLQSKACRIAHSVGSCLVNNSKNVRDFEGILIRKPGDGAEDWEFRECICKGNLCNGLEGDDEEKKWYMQDGSMKRGGDVGQNGIFKVLVILLGLALGMFSPGEEMMMRE